MITMIGVFMVTYEMHESPYSYMAQGMCGESEF